MKKNKTKTDKKQVIEIHIYIHQNSLPQNRNPLPYINPTINHLIL